ncbi:MAG: putative CRISPR-associated protein [Chloroflexus sp.]
MPPNLIVSTCGASVLTNKRADDERRLLNRYANARTRDDVARQSPDEAARLDAIIADVSQRMTKATPDEAKRQSAELNGLLTFYGSGTIPAGDAHVLLCTDTWLGEVAADIVCNWLKQQGGTAWVERQRDLQTENLESFQIALAELVQWCEETLLEWRHKGYYVVFNLTGGFKSVQGFMQTLASFYADETVYIFESGSSLLRIPRLPVRMDATDAIKSNLSVFRRLANKLPVAQVSGIPETLLMKVEQEYALSPWGELVWSQSRCALYAGGLHPPPSDRIRFSLRFKQSTDRLSPERYCILNERIDDLAVYLEQNINRKRLDFKPLRGDPRPPSTHERDAWADQDARRLFGHFEGKTFVLDALDKGLH